MNGSSDEDSQKNERSRNISNNEESYNQSETHNYTMKQKKEFILLIYNINEKIKITSEAQEKSLHSTSRKYNIDRKALLRWVKDIEKLKNVNNKKERKNLNGGGRKSYKIDIEKYLVEFIDKFREIEIGILTYELIIEAIKLMPTLANNSYNAKIM